jgi:hypothetical protein
MTKDGALGDFQHTGTRALFHGYRFALLKMCTVPIFLMLLRYRYCYIHRNDVFNASSMLPYGTVITLIVCVELTVYSR